MKGMLRSVSIACAGSMFFVLAATPANAAADTESMRQSSGIVRQLPGGGDEGTGRGGSVGSGSTPAVDRSVRCSVSVEEAEAAIAAMSPEEQAEVRALEAELRRAKGSKTAEPSTRVIPAAILAAAAVCATGALSGVAWGIVAQGIAKLVNWKGEGAFPSGAAHVGNAVVGCLTGGLGGVVWKFLPASVKAKAVGVVVGIMMRMHR